jgi:hypothetical protein
MDALCHPRQNQGVFFLCRHYFPQMQAQGQDGHSVTLHICIYKGIVTLDTGTALLWSSLDTGLRSLCYCALVLSAVVHYCRYEHNFNPNKHFFRQDKSTALKGQCHEIFSSGFYLQTVFLLGPVDKPRNDFDFSLLFTEILDYFGASPVSTTPMNNSSPVSTTPVSDTFTVLVSFTGVNDTGKKLLTGVIDTGEACIRWCH